MFGCVTVTGIGVLCSAFALAEGLLRSATLLHTAILKSGLRAPMSFFDSTPIGRIINRFSKDIDVVDSQLPRSLHSWVVCALSVIGTICVISYSTPMFLMVIVPISIIYYLVQVQLATTFGRFFLLFLPWLCSWLCLFLILNFSRQFLSSLTSKLHLLSHSIHSGDISKHSCFSDLFRTSS